MNLNLSKIFNENFSLKLFFAFGIMASLISVFFTGYYLLHQSRLLNTNIEKNGIFQVNMLAHSSRLGVFSENEEFLHDPVKAVFQQDEVQEIIIYNLEGRVLIKFKRKGSDANSGIDETSHVRRGETLNKVKHLLQPVFFEKKEEYEFWAPVLSRSGNSLSEPLGLDDTLLRDNDGDIIGYAMIRIGKESLIRQLKELLFMGVVILVLFLTTAFFASYFIAKGITKRLIRLINSVNTIEMGGVAEKLPVEGRDEIGLLAESFNKMNESLKRRQDELKIANRELMKQSEQRKMLSKRLIDILEKDREHVAMELHDHIGQILISLKINLEIIQGQLGEENSSLESRIKTSRERTVQALQDIRHISRGLKPSVLDSLGLVASLKELINEYKQNTEIDFKFFTHKVPERFGKEKELAIYRITQEALNNIIKHANAATVFITIVLKGERISLSIEDDGIGFDLEKAMKYTDGRGYLGLLFMRERAEQLDGEFSIDSETGKGTHLLLEIPV